jgi:hypothetical protein
MKDCASLSNVLSSVSTIFAVLLLISELLPYASSSKCNSITEGVSHVFCRASCLVSNKNIRFENEELKNEVIELKDTKKALTEEITHLKQVVLTDMANDIKQLRKSFETHKVVKRTTDEIEIYIK